jgi:phosphoglycolate phosphatase
MKLVVFDCDGTLLDSQRAIYRAMAATFAAHGLEKPRRHEVVGVVGLSLREAIKRLVGPREPEEIAALSRAFEEEFLRLRQHPSFEEPLFPGARAAIVELAAQDGFALGIATGKPRSAVQHMLDANGLEPLFATIQTADDHPSKPHPSMLIKATTAVGVGSQDTVMVGDTEFDVLMGKAAGAKTIGVGWGYQQSAVLEAAGADLIVDKFENLKGGVLRLLG